MPDDMANFLPNASKMINKVSEAQEASHHYSEDVIKNALLSGDPFAIKKLLLDYHRKRVAQLEADMAGK